MKQQMAGLFVGAGLVLAGVLLTAFLGDRAGWSRPRRTVTVTGTATVRVSPDSARIDFALLKSGATMEKARQNGAQACKLLEADLDKALRKHSLIKTQVLKTDSLVFRNAPPNSSAPKNPLAIDDLPPGGTGPREDREYALITFLTVEVEAADVGVLEQAVRDAADVALRHRATYNPNASTYEPAERSPQVTFSRRSTAAERQQALEDALAAARSDAQKLAGAPVPVEVIEVSEQTPMPVVVTLTNFPPGRQVYTQPGPPVGAFAGGGPRTALDSEITCKVVVKFAF